MNDLTKELEQKVWKKTSEFSWPKRLYDICRNGKF